MEKDYQDIWIRWVAFLDSDMKVSKKVLDSLHIELRQGFSVIAQISFEQLDHTFAKQNFFKSVRTDLKQILLFSVWCGYSLYLISEEIDPVAENLIVREETNRLGDVWLAHYKKDQCAGLLKKIDPFLSLILRKSAQGEFDQLLMSDATSKDVSYLDANKIISFLQWTMHQGFIFGLLEQELIHGKEEEGK